ncbi:MAG TPA: protein-disulfide reductase DsbD family protein, partial [Candidatus Ozemobacteraceae bacterium]|nr:protein-disulfide reductase DsbD family protein [Candidatus Ozemobacteraceae bacterium]
MSWLLSIGVCFPLWAGPFTFTVSDAVALGDGETIVATLSWSVEPDHYLYRDRMAVKAGNSPVQVSWPTPKEKPDPFDGSLVQMYPVGVHEAGFRLVPMAAQREIGLRVDYQGCSTTTCFMPTHYTASITVPVAVTPKEPAVKIVSVSESKRDAHATEDAPGGVSTPSGETDFAKVLREQGMLWAMALAFLGGLLVSLTPCVYPMIPITLS